MSAVFDAVSDVVEDVVDVVGDVVEAVGDVASGAIEFVGDTVERIVEDPLPTILSIAGAAVGIPPPLTAAAVTVARGGDLEDVALSAGTAYLARAVPGALSETLSPTIIEVIGNPEVASAVVNGISSGLVNGTVAEISGRGDFDDAFAGGFTGSIINSSVGEISKFVTPDVQEMLTNAGLDPSTAGNIVGAGTRAAASGITAELTGRGSFETAFANSIGKNAINFATNSISGQFRSVERGGVEQGRFEDDDQYYAGETATDTESTGAGIPESLISEVAEPDFEIDEVKARAGSDQLPEPTELGFAVAPPNYELDELMARVGADLPSFTPDYEADEVTARAGTDYPDFEADEVAARVGADLPSFTRLPSLGKPRKRIPSGYARVVKGFPRKPHERIHRGLVDADRFDETEAPGPVPESGPQLTQDGTDLEFPTAPMGPAEDAIDVPQIAGAPHSDTGLAIPYNPYEPVSQVTPQETTEEQGPPVDIVGAIQKNETETPGGLRGVASQTGRALDQNIGALKRFMPPMDFGLTRGVTRQRPAMPRAQQPSPVRGLAQPRPGVALPVPRQPLPIEGMSGLPRSAPISATAPRRMDIRMLTPITSVESLTSILNRGKG